MKKFRGFTLAEVLITLGIIGIVAALTLPSLIDGYREKEIVTKLKKNYSIFSQAFERAIDEHGTPDNWNLIAISSPQGAQNILDIFSQYLNITKNCGVDTGCFPDVTYKNLANVNDGNYNTLRTKAKAILNDGTMFSVDVRDPNCSINRGNSTMLENLCGILYIDVNGFKPPNQNGKDTFQFYITKNAIVPRGIQGDVDAFEDTCKKGQAGYNCTGWVIFNENMDYLKCDDLNWNTKTKCK